MPPAGCAEIGQGRALRARQFARGALNQRFPKNIRFFENAEVFAVEKSQKKGKDKSW